MPRVLSEEEVLRLLEAAPSPKHKAPLNLAIVESVLCAQAAVAAPLRDGSYQRIFPFLQKLFAHGGYRGPHSPPHSRQRFRISILKLSNDRMRRLASNPCLWIFGRTIAWLDRCP
jgi:hypothetical protein